MLTHWTISGRLAMRQSSTAAPIRVHQGQFRLHTSRSMQGSCRSACAARPPSGLKQLTGSRDQPPLSLEPHRTGHSALPDRPQPGDASAHLLHSPEGSWMALLRYNSHLGGRRGASLFVQVNDARPIPSVRPITLSARAQLGMTPEGRVPRKTTSGDKSILYGVPEIRMLGEAYAASVAVHAAA